MRNFPAILCFLILALAGLGTPASADRLIPERWQTRLLSDHKLVGRIWVHARNAIGTERDLKFLVEKADFVLLGEKHNNPDHHVLQAALLRLAAAGEHKDLIVGSLLEAAKVEGQKLMVPHREHKLLSNLVCIRPFIVSGGIAGGCWCRWRRRRCRCRR